MVCPHSRPIPLHLAETIIPMVVAKWWFSNPIIPSTFISSHSTIRKSSISFPSFLPSFIHSFSFVIWICGFLFYPMSYKLLHSLFILLPKLSQNLTRGVLSSLLFCPFDMSIVLWAFLYFLEHQGVPGSSCTFPAPALESAISPRIQPWFLLVEIPK